MNVGICPPGAIFEFAEEKAPPDGDQRAGLLSASLCDNAAQDLDGSVSIASQWRRAAVSASSSSGRSDLRPLSTSLDAKRKRKQAAAEAVQRGPDLDELGYSDEDLLYILFGVPDGRMIRRL
jgi:hypothetical protein